MSDWFVTGKKGNGKSLLAVKKIQEYLSAGRPVATNLDLYLEHMLDSSIKDVRVIRIPDKPCFADLALLGAPNSSGYDETKNGLLVLDELATWFNSRSWNDKERQKLMDWFVQARKDGWDILFLIQDISMADKQAREGLSEHVVYCRRSDNLTIPGIGLLYSVITGKKMSLPKAHVGIVKYGDSQRAPVVEVWRTRGVALYRAYNTRQKFSSYYPHGCFSYLSPWQLKGRHCADRNGDFFMRLSKIILRRFSRPLVGGVGFLAGSILAASLVFAAFVPDPVPLPGSESVSSVDLEAIDKKRQVFFDSLHGGRLKTVSFLPGMPPSFSIMTLEGDLVRRQDIIDNELTINVYDRNKVIISKGVDYVTLVH